MTTQNLVPENEIDAGAQALRQRQTSGRIMRSWSQLPPSDKRKWRDYAACVLTAALSARIVAGSDAKFTSDQSR